jgi:hypothetical protein
MNRRDDTASERRNFALGSAQDVFCAICFFFGRTEPSLFFAILFFDSPTSQVRLPPMSRQKIGENKVDYPPDF